METIYLIVPLTILLLGVMVWALLWAIRSDQYDDLEGPAYRVLMDDDGPVEDRSGGREQHAAGQEDRAHKQGGRD